MSPNFPLQMELDDYLEQLASEGSRESSGSFTLDVRKALEKLRSFRFAAPEDYVLNLVAAAHAAGSPSLEVTPGFRSLVLRYRGRAAGQDELAELFHRLFAAEGDTYLQELAVGLFGATRAHTRPIILETWDPGGPAGWRMILHPSHLEVEPHRLDLGPASCTRIVIPCSRGPGPEVNLIRARCRPSGVSILVGSERLEPGWEPGGLVLRLTATRGTRASQPFEGPPAQEPDCALDLEADEEFSLVAQFRPDLEYARPCMIRWGVAFSSHDGGPLAGIGDRSWVFSPHLQTDLSQGTLVQEQEVLDRLARLAWAGWARLASSDCLDPFWQEFLTARLLRGLAQLDRPRPQRWETGGVPWEPLLEARWLPLATGGMAAPQRVFACRRERQCVYVAESLWKTEDQAVPVLLQSPLLREPVRQLFSLGERRVKDIRHAW